MIDSKKYESAFNVLPKSNLIGTKNRRPKNPLIRDNPIRSQPETPSSAAKSKPLKNLNNETVSPIEGTLAWTISKRRREQGGFLGYDVVKKHME